MDKLDCRIVAYTIASLNEAREAFNKIRKVFSDERVRAVIYKSTNPGKTINVEEHLRAAYDAFIDIESSVIYYAYENKCLKLVSEELKEDGEKHG